MKVQSNLTLHFNNILKSYTIVVSTWGEKVGEKTDNLYCPNDAIVIKLYPIKSRNFVLSLNLRGYVTICLPLSL